MFLDRSLLPSIDRNFFGLIAASVVGAVIGGFLLLNTPHRLFEVLIPVLLGFATVIFACSPQIAAWLRARNAARGRTTISVTSVPLLLPISVYLDRTGAVILMSGIYYGAMYGGSITSILIKIPGEAASVITCIDGYQMARKGRAGAALGISAIGSFLAGIAATLGIAFVGPKVANVALAFGPVEKAAMLVLGLTLILGVGQGSKLRGTAMIGLGLLLGTVGIDAVSGEERFVFDVPSLRDGFGIAIVAMGLFGLSEVLMMVEQKAAAPAIMAYSRRLRDLLPGVSLHAFTATATAQVRRDIRTQLGLRDPVELVGGFDRVFEIGRVFRNEGLSTRHNTEFTMLELYEAFVDYHEMATLTEELVAHCALAASGSTQVELEDGPLDLAPPWRRVTMRDAIREHAGVDVHPGLPVEEVRAICDRFDIPHEPAWGSGKLMLEIYEKTTEHALWGPVFVLDYPREVSPLARVHRDDPLLTERFEVIIGGRELANAFSELNDPIDQRERFEGQAAQREAGDEEAHLVDEDFLRALEFGMPPTAGEGIGIDRLVMLFTDSHSIRDVLLFPHLRPEA